MKNPFAHSMFASLLKGLLKYDDLTAADKITVNEYAPSSRRTLNQRQIRKRNRQTGRFPNR